jgi:F-type H+-transporting ATPase subunit b
LERLFNLDAQLLFDSVVLAISVLVLFTFLSYLLFNPVRDMLEARRQRVVDEQLTAKKEKEDAIAYKAEYEQKLREVDKEAQEILSTARKKALKNENQIIAEAKEEAARIIERANNQIEMEKKRVADDMKKEMISVASVMAGKIVSASIDMSAQESLIDETLKEMGDSTWQS